MTKPFRLKEIVTILLREPDFISVNQIASLLDCSAKTVRNELTVLEKHLDPAKAAIQKIPSKGIRLNLIDSKYDPIRFIGQSPANQPLSVKERLFCLSVILLANGSIHPKKAIDKLHISRSVFHADLQKIARDFANYKIQLIRRQNNDVAILAKERYIRACLLDLLSRLQPDKLFSDFFKNSAPRLNSKLTEWRETNLFRLLNEFIDLTLILSEITAFWPSIYRFFLDFLGSIPIQSFSNFSLILIISLLRISEGHYVQLSDEFISYLNARENQEAQKLCFDLCQAIQKFSSISVSDTERLYIQFYFMTLGRQVPQTEQEHSNELALTIVSYIVRYLKKHFCIDLTAEPDIFRLFSNHIAKLVIRLSHNIKIDNPNKDVIQASYPRSWAVAENVLRHFKNKFNTSLSSDEVAYVAILIELVFEKHKLAPRGLLICLEDINIANLIKAKLSNRFPNLTLDLLTDITRLSLEPATSYDIILSTSDLPEIKQDYILVSPILTELDLNNVKTKLKSFKP